MNSGVILLVLIGVGGFCLGLIGCYLASSHAEQQRHDDMETQRLMQQPWDVQGSRGNR